MSPMYLRPGSVAVKSRSNRSGTARTAGSGTVVRTLLRRRMPAIPCMRMTRATRLWLTRVPVSRSSAVTRGKP